MLNHVRPQTFSDDVVSGGDPAVPKMIAAQVSPALHFALPHYRDKTDPPPVSRRRVIPILGIWVSLPPLLTGMTGWTGLLIVLDSLSVSLFFFVLFYLLFLFHLFFFFFYFIYIRDTLPILLSSLSSLYYFSERTLTSRTFLCLLPSPPSPGIGTRSPATMAVLPRGIKQVLTKAPTDVVIVSSLRTPICRSYKGGLKDAYPEELLSVVLRATLDKTPQLDPKKIDDVAVGVVLNELGGSKAARMALNHVGFDTSSTSLYTANRACASSLQAIALIAAQIRTEMIDAGIGAGMESMTRNYGTKAIPVDVWPELKESPVEDARDCVMSMGITSENVAERYGVSRADQDALAVESHLRAARAQEKGYFDGEIVPVKTRWQEVSKTGEKVGEEKEVTVARDDGIRANASLEGLAKLKPAFKSDGASTAGNSSQVSDGAAATLLMRRSTATQLGLADSIMGKFVGASVSGCRPDEMGIGPALAIPKILGQLGLANEDVHRWEINEAFASQALYCIRELGLEKALAEGRVNPDGGAIALGHPLGATGARMVSTLMHGMRRTGGEVGVVSMCIGTGMGMAGVFVRE